MTEQEMRAELWAIDKALGFPRGFTSAAGQTRADLIDAIRMSADSLQAQVIQIERALAEKEKV